jgi:hypothetical protein
MADENSLEPPATELPELGWARARLAGLLGEDEDGAGLRRADHAFLRSVGITTDQIADRLDYVLGRAERLRDLALRERLVPSEYGEMPVVVEGRYQVSWIPVREREACPLGSLGAPCREDCSTLTIYTVRDVTTGESLFPRAATAHFVRAHGFFEGGKARRAAPDALVRFFRTTPASSGRPVWTKERVWVPLERTDDARPVGRPKQYWQSRNMPKGERCPKRWDETLEVAPELSLRRAGDWCVAIAHEDLVLPRGFTCDGSEFATERVIRRGVVQLRREERSWVAPRLA